MVKEWLLWGSNKQPSAHQPTFSVNEASSGLSFLRRHKRLDGGGLVLGSKVRVAQRHRNRFVSEQFTNGVEIDARHNELASKRVPEIVEPEAFHLRRLQDSGHPFLMATRGFEDSEPLNTHHSGSLIVGRHAFMTSIASLFSGT